MRVDTVSGDTCEGRQSFLSELGWEIDPDTEEFKSVTLPEALEGVMRDYNEMQLAQGYDLRKYLGQTCSQYTYEVTNYPQATDTVLVTLYIKGQRVIAGDIHTLLTCTVLRVIFSPYARIVS